jgi:hypothetical protein
LHNFIIDFREACDLDDNGYEMDREYEYNIFDDECRRFLAVCPDLENEEGGVHGGGIRQSARCRFQFITRRKAVKY